MSTYADPVLEIAGRKCLASKDLTFEEGAALYAGLMDLNAYGGPYVWVKAVLTGYGFSADDMAFILALPRRKKRGQEGSFEAVTAFFSREEILEEGAAVEGARSS